jgi:hypothetical protein
VLCSAGERRRGLAQLSVGSVVARMGIIAVKLGDRGVMLRNRVNRYDPGLRDWASFFLRITPRTRSHCFQSPRGIVVERAAAMQPGRFHNSYASLRCETFPS